MTKTNTKTDKRRRYLEALRAKFQCGDSRYIDGMTDKEFRDLICKYFLGENFVAPCGMSDEKVTTVAAYCIIKNN